MPRRKLLSSLALINFITRNQFDTSIFLSIMRFVLPVEALSSFFFFGVGTYVMRLSALLGGQDQRIDRRTISLLKSACSYIPMNSFHIRRYYHIVKIGTNILTLI